MKALSLLFLFAFFATGVFSQNNSDVREEYYASGVLKAQYIPVAKNLVKVTFFYENGSVRETGFYKKGKLQGHWVSYNEDAQKWADAYFQNNRKSGTWLYWDGDEIVGMVNYQEDNLMVSN